MKIVSWNVNGIRAIAKKGFLEFFEHYQPDILCLQETKAHPEQVTEETLTPPGYEIFWSSAEKKGYSGVATFSKLKPKNVHYGLGEQRFDSEGRTIITEFEKFILFNIYFPNGQKDDERLKYKLDFYDCYLDVAENLRKKGKPIITCGDYNTAHKEIDLTHPKANEQTSGFLPIERAWLDKYIESGYIDTFREFNKNPKEYTWWSYRMNARAKNVGWRIDYFFISEELKKNLKSAFILQDVHGSDHCPLGIEIHL